MKEKFNKKLLVEGIDDQHVLFALCQKFNIEESFDIIDCKGIDNLLEQIPFRFKNGNDTIGIIIDADVNLESQFLRLKKIVESLGFKVPDKLPIDGFINLNENNNKVGIWIMPNNQVAGMLEDFITFLVPKDDKLLPIVDETLNAIENQEKNKYKYIHKYELSQKKFTLYCKFDVQ